MLFSGKCGMIYLNLVKEWRQHKLHLVIARIVAQNLLEKKSEMKEVWHGN